MYRVQSKGGARAPGAPPLAVYATATAYLHEVQDHLYQFTGTLESASTICRKERGFTRKRIEAIALQRSEQKRIEHMVEMLLFNLDMFIWIDDTGSDRRKSMRSYRYSLRGIPPQLFVEPIIVNFPNIMSLNILFPSTPCLNKLVHRASEANV